MAGVKRLITESPSDFERRLLSAGLGERPSLARRRRMAQAVGVGSLIAYSSEAKALLGGWAVKLGLGLGLAVVATVVITEPGSAGPSPAQPGGDTIESAVRTPHASQRAPEASSVSRPGPAHELAKPSQQSRQASEDVPAVESARAAQHEAQRPPEAAVRRPVRRPAVVLDAARAPAALSEEVALLDRARALLQGGRTGRALALLESYHRRFPSGVLAREAKLLRERAAAFAAPSAPGE